MKRAKYLVVWQNNATGEKGASYTSWLDLERSNPDMEWSSSTGCVIWFPLMVANHGKTWTTLIIFEELALLNKKVNLLC